jgi:DNA gyrase subunit A
MVKNNQKLNREIGQVKPREITEEMKKSYIDYAMSVIIARALPDVRDGLKPVHRRILYAMLEDGLRHNAKFRKSATVTGSVLGRYHPHGDQAVYDALVRMAQDFSLRYPLIQGQGNFGSIDGDPPAAQRYTECRLSKIGERMLEDIEKNTVDFVDNYDGTRQEPTVLPSPLPQLLLNGSLGIAVGMTTNIPPHNLSEIVDALIYLLDHSKADTKELFDYIQGPDFPTGGEIFNKKEIIQAYSQGKGSIVIRGRGEIVKDEKRKRRKIIISEIPYQIQKSSLVREFAELVQKKKLRGIKDIRDESDKEGLRIVIDLNKGTNAKHILNRLYKFTSLQKKFYLNMLALVDGIQPKVLSLPDILSYFILHRKEVVVRRTKYDLEKAKEREHILEGLEKCLSRIDEVIKTIKKSSDRKEAHRNLMKRFRLTSLQAEAILETKLSALARLEIKKIEEELKELKAKIKELSAILKSKKKITQVVRKELKILKEEFGDERKTKLREEKVSEFKLEDLIPQEEAIITLTQGGYIKRLKPSTYKTQKRGGKGILGMKTMGEDIIEHFLLANTHDSLLFFTDSGRVFSVSAYEIPEATRVAKGRGLLNFLEISPREKVLAIFALQNKEKQLKEKFLVMVTKNGIIKKTKLEDFKNVRKTGKKAISLSKEDILRKVKETEGSDEIILVTEKGQSIRFDEKEVRPMGRAASGVRGIRLRKGKESKLSSSPSAGAREGDEVIGMEIIKSKTKNQKPKAKEYLLVITEKGYGKRTDLGEYKPQKRGGIGIKTANVNSKTGPISAIKILTGEKELIVISQKAQVIRTKISPISILSRNTQGVRIMKLEEGDKIASIICI